MFFSADTYRANAAFIAPELDDHIILLNAHLLTTIQCLIDDLTVWYFGFHPLPCRRLFGNVLRGQDRESHGARHSDDGRCNGWPGADDDGCEGADGAHGWLLDFQLSLWCCLRGRIRG